MECKDKECPIHGRLSVRGRYFEGKIKKIFPRRVVIEFERIVYYPKYERYARKKTRIHARLPDCIADKAKIGNMARVGECRPLSKLIHHVVLEIK